VRSDLGERIQMLRKRCGLSIRKLADQARITPGMISFIERNKTSPSLATLQKILQALGTDLATFFSTSVREQKGPVFSREDMQAINDPDRRYTIVFPRAKNVHVEMFDEEHLPTGKKPPFEKLKCDVAGYLLSGNTVLEIKGRPKRQLRPGDAFYIPKGVEHRGYVINGQPARLITVYWPGKY